MRLGYHTITWGGVVGDPTGVTSVKDLYYRSPGSMKTAISDIAAAGYEGTEMFDGNVADFADSPPCSATAGRRRPGTGQRLHRRQLHLRRRPRRRAAPGLPRRRAGATIRRRQPRRRRRGPPGRRHHRRGLRPARCRARPGHRHRRAAGLAASYHPHLTTIVESPDELERLMPQTRIGFCPDTAHLAAGGGDPAAADPALPRAPPARPPQGHRPRPSRSCRSARA